MADFVEQSVISDKLNSCYQRGILPSTITTQTTFLSDGQTATN